MLSFKWGDELTLTANCSSDPDLDAGSDPDFVFEWFCNMPCESVPVFDSQLNFIQWSANMNPYSTSCSLNGSNIVFQGCFLPQPFHKSGPLVSYSLDSWTQSSLAEYPLNASLNSNFKDYFKIKEWLYFMNDTINNTNVLYFIVYAFLL